MDDDSIANKEAWQVVACPQCGVPPGIKCAVKTIGIKIHGGRKRSFNKLLEDEGLNKPAQQNRKSKIGYQEKSTKPSWRDKFKTKPKDDLEESSEDVSWKQLSKQTLKEDSKTPSKNLNWGDLARKLRKDQNLPVIEKKEDLVKDIPSVRKFIPRIEPNEIWNEYSCPTCKAIPGMRCIESLGQSRSSSHTARVQLFKNDAHK